MLRISESCSCSTTFTTPRWVARTPDGAPGPQLREWAENYPPTFADKHTLVSAEIARIEGRDADAMRCTSRLFSRRARTASSRTRRWPMRWPRGSTRRAAFETFAHTYLRNARNCYDRWGALGKVKQLDERYPRLREERLPASSTATIGTPVGQLDVETVVKASQALSSEIVLPS
jgi:hypothetical protein